MARFAGEIVFVLALALSIPLASAQTFSPSAEAGATKPDAGAQRFRKELEQLSPEQRERLKENLKQWQALTPEEKDLLRQREAMAQLKLRQAAEDSSMASGLSLASERKQAYVARYLQERRGIELNLRLEAQHKRKPLVQEMTAQLNAQFARNGGGSIPSAGSEGDPNGGGQLSAEQKQRIFDGLDRWKQPTQTENPIQRLRREKWKANILQQIDQSLKQSGLNLDDEGKKLYAWRYLMSRRRIEQAIRMEMEEHRKARLNELTERLKAEFSAPAGAPSTSGS